MNTHIMASIFVRYSYKLKDSQWLKTQYQFFYSKSYDGISNVVQNVCYVVVLSPPLHMFWVVVCPTIMTQGHYTCRHNQVLNCRTTDLSKVLSKQYIVYADLPGWHAMQWFPQATVPPFIL